MPEPGRRPLKPLPDELGGTVRDFTEQLRAVFRDRTELNQRELAEALHLTKSPVSRYLNGQEVMPADTFAAFCDVAGLAPRERQRLGRLREQAAEATERERNAPDEAAEQPGQAGQPRQAGRRESPAPSVWCLPAGLHSRAGLVALVAAVAVCAGTFAVVWSGTSGTPDRAGSSAKMTADEPDSSASCRMTRVYRVMREGDILDAGRNDIGDVHTDDIFRLDEAPAGRPYRFRDYGHVAGSRTKGYVDQAKLKSLGSRCVGEGG
ncbi:helix-turn-helix domain-containing protein [Streptomyces bathyalis]|uniref:Helix-turn-helix domain-containing protein n=1 Tax=Streptomyces bathyalis TaxID=2710756 RepID=A0A7T1T6U3_9ACTN|nr:helix-turn-helix transcriptional regulator [Streptomyces bathyalis]QPP07471.1 helix-turn-helix domain-containing protein [Streptomyces bathyalis]